MVLLHIFLHLPHHPYLELATSITSHILCCYKWLHLANRLNQSVNSLDG